MLDFISFAPGRSLARSPARRLARSARWLRALALTGLVGTVPLPALAAPQAVGPPITVYNGLANLLLPEEQASVDARANGDFAVAWIDDFGSVRVQRYGANGVAQTAALVAGVRSVDNYNYFPDVAMGEDGSVVVVWQQLSDSSYSSAVLFRRILPSGFLSGSAPALVAVPPAPLVSGFLRYDGVPAVAAGVDGRFVVTWQRRGSHTHPTEAQIRARSFTAAGNFVTGGPEFAANRVDLEVQDEPDVAMDASGAYVIVWERHFATGPQNGSIRMKRFNAFGQVNGAEQVVAENAGPLTYPAVGMNAAGDSTLVAWITSSDTGRSVSARHYGAGSPAVFDVAVQEGWHNYLRVSSDATGRFAVMWGEQQGAHSFDPPFITPVAQLRRYDTFGVAMDTTPFLIVADDIALDADGDLVVVASSVQTSPGLLSVTSHTVTAQRLQGQEPVDLTVTHQILSAPSSFPGNVTYRVRVSNLHPPVALGVAPVVQNAIGAATQVVVDTNSGFAVPSGTNWTCVPASPGPRCSYGPSLAPGQTAPDLIVTRTVSSGGGGLSPANLLRSVVRANQIDPNLTNNTAQTLVVVSAP